MRKQRQARRDAGAARRTPASTISIAATSAREIAADLERIGSPVTRADLKRYRAALARAAVAAARGRDALQHARADPGPRLADHARHLRAARRRATPKLRPRPRADRGDQARARRSATASASISTCTRISRATCRRRSWSGGRAHRHDAAPRPGRCRRRRATRSGWARSTRDGLAVSYIQSIYWEYGSGCVLPRTGVLMQNRGVAFSLDRARRKRAEAGAAAVPHAQPAARRVRRRARAVLRRDGRRRAAAVPGAGVHPHRRGQSLARRRRRAAPAVGPRLGRESATREGRGGLRRRARRGPGARRPRDRAARRREARRCSATPARCCATAKGEIAAAHDPRADGGAEGFEAGPLPRRSMTRLRRGCGRRVRY